LYPEAAAATTRRRIDAVLRCSGVKQSVRRRAPGGGVEREFHRDYAELAASGRSRLNRSIFRLFREARGLSTGADPPEHAESLTPLAGEFANFALEYDFGVDGVHARRVDLATWGHAFERSLQGERKSGGIYYTPVWLARLVVGNTLGPRLEALRRAAGLEESLPADARLERLDDYAACLARVTLIDPACGSGAFLLEAQRQLRAAWRALDEERASLTGASRPPDSAPPLLVYGVDIQPEAVELSRFLLWLDAARPELPLDAFDKRVLAGNALFDSAFDFQASFPEVFAQQGFDCVVGNPPYVKLQNLRQQDDAFASWLLAARLPDGRPRYRTTQTGNFDIYLPFIERGLELLGPDGQLGFVAPSTWLKSGNGAGLRRLLLETQQLWRWVDFGDAQLFDAAATYTAAQFFRKKPSHIVECVLSPASPVDGIDWTVIDAHVPYAQLDPERPWVFASSAERFLLQRLHQSCQPLEHVARAIVVGIQTSADHVYHLSKQYPGTYLTQAGHLVELEDEILRPLLSGDEAKRYAIQPSPRCLLFPYDDGAEPVRLIDRARLARDFPQTWSYLRACEPELRARENGAFDDASWYRFGRNQNIDKQRLPKLGVAQTVPHLRVFFDAEAAYCFNNVRVNGILTETLDDGWFLLGVLNGKVADFVFRRIAKPKRGGYFEANKQFIAPLPIPKATAAQKREVAELARRLQKHHTAEYRLPSKLDDAAAIDRREIEAAERELEALLARLYGLSPSEIELLALDAANCAAPKAKTQALPFGKPG